MKPGPSHCEAPAAFPPPSTPAQTQCPPQPARVASRRGWSISPSVFFLPRDKGRLVPSTASHPGPRMPHPRLLRPEDPPALEVRPGNRVAGRGSAWARTGGHTCHHDNSNDSDGDNKPFTGHCVEHMLNPHSSHMRLIHGIYFHLTNGETEAQSCLGTCPESHSSEVEEKEFLPVLITVTSAVILSSEF